MRSCHSSKFIQHSPLTAAQRGGGQLTQFALAGLHFQQEVSYTWFYQLKMQDLPFLGPKISFFSSESMPLELSNILRDENPKLNLRAPKYIAGRPCLVLKWKRSIVWKLISITTKVFIDQGAYNK